MGNYITRAVLGPVMIHLTREGAYHTNYESTYDTATDGADRFAVCRRYLVLSPGQWCSLTRRGPPSCWRRGPRGCAWPLFADDGDGSSCDECLQVWFVTL
jgi:hypothetical protein